MPNNSNTSLLVSTTECMPSETIAELPVKAAAMNFVMAIRRFAPSAVYIAGLEEAMQDKRKKPALSTVA